MDSVAFPHLIINLPFNLDIEWIGLDKERGSGLATLYPRFQSIGSDWNWIGIGLETASVAFDFIRFSFNALDLFVIQFKRIQSTFDSI